MFNQTAQETQEIKDESFIKEEDPKVKTEIAISKPQLTTGKRLRYVSETGKMIVEVYPRKDI